MSLVQTSPEKELCDDQKTTELDDEQKTLCAYWKRLMKFIDENYFICVAFFGIVIAAAVPFIGRKGGPLRTEYWVGYGCNAIIFLISGITLKTETLINALANVKLNLIVLINIFVVTTWFFTGVSHALRGSGMNMDIVDGILILGALPTTVNMCVVMTTSSKGNASAALFNATFTNIMGIFISPAYIFWLLGAKGSVSFSEVLLSLTYKVIIPTFIGQILVNVKINAVENFLKALKPYTKRIQETLLCMIVWATFSTTFYNKVNVSATDVILIIVLMCVMQCICYIMFWFELGLPVFEFSLKDRIAGMFCSTHKTMALGIPLITAIYENYDNVGLYTLPLLIYHPAQIVFGALIAPRLAKKVTLKEYTEREQYT